MNTVVLPYKNALARIVTSVREYEQDKSIRKYPILFRNEVIIILQM